MSTGWAAFLASLPVQLGMYWMVGLLVTDWWQRRRQTKASVRVAAEVRAQRVREREWVQQTGPIRMIRPDEGTPWVRPYVQDELPTEIQPWMELEE